ncbi:MAG: glycosyltransferase [Candidatus Bathyarchaeia archaeon]
MRILHISNPVSIPVKGYGGTERIIYSLAKRQAENGHEVTVIAGKPSFIPNVKDASFMKGSPYTERKFIIKRFLTAYSMRAMLVSRSDKFDIIHNHISEEAIPLTIFSKYPVITTLHCPLTLRKIWPFITTSVASLLPRKTKFVTISKRAFKVYRPFFGNDLITYIHNGIDISGIPFNPKPKKNHEIQLCFLGKLVPEKHPILAIKIADLLYKQGYDVKLFMMGKLDFPLSKYAEKLVKMVKLRKYVTLLPNIATDKMYNILGNCDCLIATSFEIGLVTAQLEALATGTPIVGLMGGSAEEVVIEGYNGYLGINLYDMASKCVSSLNIDRRNCRKIVENNFNEQRMYDNYMKIYEVVLSERLLDNQTITRKEN